MVYNSSSNDALDTNMLGMSSVTCSVSQFMCCLNLLSEESTLLPVDEEMLCVWQSLAHSR